MLHRPHVYQCFKRLSTKRSYNASSTISELDHVLLKHADPRRGTTFTKPLLRGRTLQTQYGRIAHDNIIGLRERDLVETHKSTKLRVHLPSLEEYVTLSPRRVTPIYPSYASLITSILDLHPSPPPNPQPCQPELSILEAGTGHGGLTLYLARALQAGNPALPLRVFEDMHNERMHYIQQNIAASEAGNFSDEPWASDDLDAYKATRKAVLHTLDIDSKNSLHARKLVRGFRRGMYYPSVDFHVGSVMDFLETRAGRLEGNKEEQRLSHILLDLPSPQSVLRLATQALKTAGSVVVFVPSVTQLGECVKAVREQQLPLILEQALEVGTGLAGGREWDIREAKVRAKVSATQQGVPEDIVDQAGNDVGNDTITEGDQSLGGEECFEGIKPELDVAESATSGSSSNWEMVCRPKVGSRVVGGGFIGVWRKMRFAGDGGD